LVYLNKLKNVFFESHYQDRDSEVLDDYAQKCLLNALQPGDSLVAAGYCMYSSSTVLVLTLGKGVHGFTLDPHIDEFVLSHPDLCIPDQGQIYSVNEANFDKWSPPIQKYFQALKSGNLRPTRYSARYIGSMVADVHRTLLYGGIYAYPADMHHPNGKIRLLYEAAPMSFIISQAGGRASTGFADIMAIHPTSVHQRVPIFIGSKQDIADFEAFLAANSSSDDDRNNALLDGPLTSQQVGNSKKIDDVNLSPQPSRNKNNKQAFR